jgi:photoactive yellow protein
MLDLPEPSSAATFNPRTVDDLADAALDELPFGVVGLDEEGTILRYNLYESRFARLDRNNVLGKNFFAEVAHCTRNEAFEGRFRAFVASPGGADLDRFDFLFDFKFGAQNVSVDIVRAPSSRFYLLINRTRVSGPRAEVPKEILAAAQGDLAPDEGLRGVRRDPLERRFVDAPAPFFAALRATCDRLAPETWEIFAGEWGVQWGRRAAVDLEATALERGQPSLRETPMREVAALVSAYFGERGWGSPTFDFSSVNEGVLVVALDRSALAEAAPRRRSAAGSADRACHLFAGCVGGILSAIAGRRLAAREVSCVAAGHDRCEVIVIGHERRAAADAALRQGARGVDALRTALRRAPRTGRDSESSR